MAAANVSALVVDDSPAMRKQLRQALERMGVHTVEASDGAHGWRQLSAAQFDIILTDVNMPILDGLKLIAMVRSGGAHQRTPIVVITTEGAAADRKRAESLGASAYLAKPVQSHQVVDTVKRLLHLP